MDEAEIPQGSEAQRRLDAESYYDEELFKKLELPEMLKDQPDFLKGLGLTPSSSRFATTSGNLANIAQIDASEKVFNPETGKMEFKYSDDFRRKIFDARMELDRMGKDMFGNTRGEGGGGIMTASTASPSQGAPGTPAPGTPAPAPPGSPIITPTPFPGTGIINAVTDPRFVGQSFPGVLPTGQNYFNQGIADPRFQRFFQIANQFPTTT